MSTRKLLLILVPAAALLIFALLHLLRDDESVSGPVASLVHEDAWPGGGAAVLPSVAGGDPTNVVALPTGDPGAAATQAPAVVTGLLAGRVADGAGHAIPGEPVYLTLTGDPWAPHANPHDDDDDQPEPVTASGTSGAQGEFSFPARAGVRYTLHAGGAHWPRVAVQDARSGDDLLVTLPEGFVLTGTVVEAESHAPVPGANVLAVAEDNHLLARTGADGAFSLGPLPAQDVVVGSYAPGFDISMQTEIAPALGPITLELPPGRELHGRVVDRETTKAVTGGGEVRLQLDVLATMAGDTNVTPSNRLVEEQKVAIDAAGTFTFASAPSFGFSLFATAPEHAPATHDRYENRAVGADDDIVIAMRPLVPIAGKVVLAAGGAGVAGAVVAASNDSGPFATGTSAADGTFSLDPRDWDGHTPVYVEARDAADHAARVVSAGDTEPLLLELVPLLHVTVRVTAGGAPVAGADVAASSDGSEPTEARTGADGTAQLAHVLAGPATGAVRLQARHGDDQSLPLVIDPRQPQVDTLALALDGGGVVEGVVLDKQGNAVPSALVRLSPDKKLAGNVAQELMVLGYLQASADLGDKSVAQTLLTHSDREGKFRIAAVVPNVAYRLRVTAESFRDFDLTPVYADPAPLTVALDPVVMWEGRVVDASSGLPQPQFIGQLLEEVQAGMASGFHPTRQRVVRKPGAPGEFSVELPEPGRFQLRLLGQDMIPALSAPADFDGSKAPPFAVLAMWPAAVLEVTILDGRGSPVPGFSVAVIPWEDAKDAETPSGDVRKAAQILRTDDVGLARFNLGEGGAYRIGSGPGQWLDDNQVSVKPGSPQKRSYTLPPTGELELTVQDEQGNPLPGVRVELRSGRDEKAHAVARQAGTHGVDGIVHFDTLPPGSYDLTLRRRNYETEKRQGVTVQGNVIERLTIAMQPRPKQDSKGGGSGAQTLSSGNR